VYDCKSSHFSLYFVLGSEDKLELFLFSHTQIYSVFAAFLLLIFYSTLFRIPPIIWWRPEKGAIKKGAVLD
ncbi:hypothetical protein QG044_11190, partial [Kingella kingae]|uniref:hypothetical protein n=1 Tax=Kingella kingae TaxID=504 RepID=UPI00254F442C